MTAGAILAAAKKPSRTVFDDPDFADRLAWFIVYSNRFLTTYGGMLTAKEFAPVEGDPHGRERWIVAERALSHWEKYGKPVGKLLRSRLIEHAQTARMSDNRRIELLEFAKCLAQMKRPEEQAVGDSVVAYKSEVRETRRHREARRGASRRQLDR